MKAFDVAKDTTGKAHQIKDLGYGAVGLYLRPDRSSKAMVDGLHSVGIKCFSVYERGNPTKATYFSADQGSKDGLSAVINAELIGQPKGTEIFSAVDYDAKPGDIQRITAYQRAFQSTVKSSGYLASVYGSGLVCKTLVDLGYAHSGWLSCSKGWTGYDDFKPHASIVQATPVKILGMDCDPDEIVDLSVLW